MGIPEGFAMTSQINDNILMSFFPAQVYGNNNSSDEENKEEDNESYMSGLNFLQRSRSKQSKAFFKYYN